MIVDIVLTFLPPHCSCSSPHPALSPKWGSSDPSDKSLHQLRRQNPTQVDGGGHLEVEVGVLLPSPVDVLPTLPNQVSPYPVVSLGLYWIGLTGGYWCCHYSKDCSTLSLYCKTLQDLFVTYCSSPLVDAISLGM